MDKLEVSDAARWPEPFDHHNLDTDAIKASTAMSDKGTADAAFATDLLMRQTTPDDLSAVRKFLAGIGLKPDGAPLPPTTN